MSNHSLELNKYRRSEHHLPWGQRNCIWIIGAICQHGEIVIPVVSPSSSHISRSPKSDNVDNVELENLFVSHHCSSVCCCHAEQTSDPCRSLVSTLMSSLTWRMGYDDWLPLDRVRLRSFLIQVYFKTWTGTINGVPPTGGGGGTGVKPGCLPR